jgi:hypothetical protein
MLRALPRVSEFKLAFFYYCGEGPPFEPTKAG